MSIKVCILDNFQHVQTDVYDISFSEVQKALHLCSFILAFILSSLLHRVICLVMDLGCQTEQC